MVIKEFLVMKKILMMSAFFTSIACTNVDAMSGYGMPSGYGQPQGMGMGMSGMGMSGMGMGMPGQQQGMQGGYGQPQGMPQQGGVNPLTQDVKDAIMQNVMNNPNLSPDIRGEAAFSVALKVGLNEAVVCITFTPNGQLFRLHTSPRNNGIVTDQAEIQMYNNMMAQAKNSGGSATIQSTIISNGKPEAFVFDVMAIDQTHLVAVRHK
jgi:hypothetical protein